MSFEPGFLVTDNVRLLRPIGEGGMGSVWVAEHIALDTEVAVKFMAPELATHPDAVERFTREARAAARMHSPHVVKMFDYGVSKDDGVPFMTMELLEGEDVEERVSRAGPLSLEETSCVVTQLAKALGEAHMLGIVHRDVKPDNVFLINSGGELFVKVLDFGIAKQLGRSQVRVTCSGTTIGTPIYMSPEQILSAKDVDYRCDLWSLAVVAYYCLTGRVPFPGETFGAVCIAIDRGRLEAPSRVRRSVPASVDAWFSKALCRDIEGRFQSVKEMSDAFVAATSGGSVSRSLAMALSVPLRTRLPKFSRTRTIAAAGIGVNASARKAARARVISFATAAAILCLTVGAMDLGRVLFGHPAEARAVLASPPVASMAAATQAPIALPRVAPVVPESVAPVEAPQMVTVIPEAPHVKRSASSFGTPVVPAARSVSAKEGGNWTRGTAKPKASKPNGDSSPSVSGASEPFHESSHEQRDWAVDGAARDDAGAPADDKGATAPPPPLSDNTLSNTPSPLVRAPTSSDDRTLGL